MLLQIILGEVPELPISVHSEFEMEGFFVFAIEKNVPPSKSYENPEIRSILPHADFFDLEKYGLNKQGNHRV